MPHDRQLAEIVGSHWSRHWRPYQTGVKVGAACLCGAADYCRSTFRGRPLEVRITRALLDPGPPSAEVVVCRKAPGRPRVGWSSSLLPETLHSLLTWLPGFVSRPLRSCGGAGSNLQRVQAYSTQSLGRMASCPACRLAKVLEMEGS